MARWPNDRDDYDRLMRWQLFRGFGVGYVAALLTLAVVACALIFAEPASAQYTETPTVWQAPDGTFTNDLKRYPDAQPHALQDRRTIVMQEPKVHLWSPPSAQRSALGAGPLYRRDNDASLSYQTGDTITGLPSGEPIIVEQVRTRRKGNFVTTTDTVVRQGDRVLMIVKPQGAQHDPGKTVIE